jgi:hypothetical protein
MAKAPPEHSAWIPRVRLTPDMLRRLEAHVERYRAAHPNTTMSEWVREALEEKMQTDSTAEKRPKKRSA